MCVCPHVFSLVKNCLRFECFDHLCKKENLTCISARTLLAPNYNSKVSFPKDVVLAEKHFISIFFVVCLFKKLNLFETIDVELIRLHLLRNESFRS